MLMRVILAAPRGFCAGVNMAIESLDLAIQAFGTPVYVYHEIVHNKYVVETFRDKGAIFVEALNEVPAGATLALLGPRRVAGDSPRWPASGSCGRSTPLARWSRRCIWKRSASPGRLPIVLIGHEGHDEVIGTMGEAPEAIVLVESPEEVDRLEFPPDAKLAYLTQTTLSVDDANRIIARLKERFPQIVGPPKEDICYATQNRQEAVRILAAQADVVLVLGSQNSSNSQRLKELAVEEGSRPT